MTNVIVKTEEKIHSKSILNNISLVVMYFKKKFCSFNACLWIAPSEIEELKSLFPCFVSLLSIISLFLAPFLVPFFYRYFLGFLIPFIFLLNCNHCVRYCISSWKLIKKVRSFSKKFYTDGNLNKFDLLQENDNNNNNKAKKFRLIHAIILPNYTEPLDILVDTISRLASHVAAKSHYVIVLAMEEGEVGYAIKASQLKKMFKNNFLFFIITVHPCNIPGESRGKGPNVGWAARKFYEFVLKNNLCAYDILLTVADADAAIPECFFYELENETLNNEICGVGRTRIFTVPLIFGRNAPNVPLLVRVVDNGWTVALMQNFTTSRSIHFPCSVYSIPLCVARDVNWWDVSADAVGEDVHMFLKCFYKSKGRFRSTPIWVPVNMTNVQSNGYFANIKAKFIQARRHLSGSKDTLFAYRETFSNNSFNSLVFFGEKLLCFWNCLEAHFIPVQSAFMVAAFPTALLVDSSFIKSSTYESTKLFTALTLFPYIIMGIIQEIVTWYILRSKIFNNIKENINRSDSKDNILKPIKTSVFQDIPILQKYSWRHCLDWVFAPISVLLFVSLPAASLAVDACRFFVGKKSITFNYVVAKKMI